MTLARINGHPRDGDITFQEEGHIYTITGIDKHPVSVTTLIHQNFPHFDADLIITKMMRGKNWPTSKYFGMNQEEIKKLWEDNGKEASGLGTTMHKSIEDFIESQVSGVPFESNGMKTKEFSFFLQFWKDFKESNPNFQPYRTEWLVYDIEKLISGSIDMTFANEKGEIAILDWKRSKEIKKSNPFGKGLGVLSHMDDCNFSHYSLQLNIYRYLLEKNYGKKVVAMYLLIFHPDNDNGSYKFFEVPFLYKEIDDLIGSRESIV